MADAAPPPAPPPAPAPLVQGSVVTTESPADDYEAAHAAKTVGLFGLAVILVIVLLLAFFLYAGLRLIGNVASSAAGLLAPGIQGARCGAELNRRADQLVAANPRLSRCAAYTAAIDEIAVSLSGACPPATGRGEPSASPPYSLYLQKMGCPAGGSV